MQNEQEIKWNSSDNQESDSEDERSTSITASMAASVASVDKKIHRPSYSNKSLDIPSSEADTSYSATWTPSAKQSNKMMSFSVQNANPKRQFKAVSPHEANHGENNDLSSSGEDQSTSVSVDTVKTCIPSHINRPINVPCNVLTRTETTYDDDEDVEINDSLSQVEVVVKFFISDESLAEMVPSFDSLVRKVPSSTNLQSQVSSESIFNPSRKISSSSSIDSSLFFDQLLTISRNFINDSVAEIIGSIAKHWQKIPMFPKNIPDRASSIRVSSSNGSSSSSCSLESYYSDSEVDVIPNPTHNRQTFTVTSPSAGTFTESDMEQGSKLDLFELLEAVTSSPTFSEFSELAKRFIRRDNVYPEATNELRKVNRQLYEDKEASEIRVGAFIRDRICLLGRIENLLLQKEGALKKRKKETQKVKLEIELQKEICIQEIKMLLKMNKKLVRDKDSLLKKNKILVFEKRNLKKDKKCLLQVNSRLLEEKEEWVRQKNALLVIINDLKLEKLQLLTENEKLTGENRILVESRKLVQQSTVSNLTTFHNDHKKIQLIGGTTKFVYANGDIKEIQPDGTENYYYKKSKKWKITQPDGTIIIKFPNDQVKTMNTDGSKTVVYPNKIIRMINANGKESFIYPDKTISVTKKGGVTCFKFSNGEKEYHHPQFRKRVYPDGTVKKIFEDDSRETKWANGRVLVKDSQGNVLYDNGEPAVP